ncbi:MAG TPA: DUF4157 domain-containing protein [Candidatus Angelobacter sp.]
MQVAFETARERDGQSSASVRARHSRPASETIHPMLSLQQQAGNQAVQHLLRSRLIQAKLAISSPDDPQEHEADRVANHVMRAGIPAAPCGCAGGGEMCEECQQKQKGTVARKSLDTEKPAVPDGALDQVLRSPGQPLDAATRASFEPHFGRDFSDVRVHTDSGAAESARAIQAHAYTFGANVVFAAGKYNSHSSDGRQLLAHELAHVVQQQQGTNRGLGGNPTIVRRQPKPGKQAPTCSPASEPVRQLPADFSTPDNVQALAEIMWHEMGTKVPESTAVGSIVVNRLLSTKFHRVAQLKSFERKADPPQSQLDLACNLLTGQVADSTNGSWYYFSPQSMPDQSNPGCCTGQAGPCSNANLNGSECGGGLQDVPGTNPPRRVFFPKFTKGKKPQPQPEGTDPMLIQVYKQ